MIARYNIAETLFRACPVYTSLTGTIFPNSFAYISNVTPGISGAGTGQSWLDKTDAILNAEDAMTGHFNFNDWVETGCLVYVGVYLTGFCAAGDTNPTFAVSGNGLRVDPYMAYLNGYSLAKILSGSACNP
jgi:hypothetical protein